MHVVHVGKYYPPYRGGIETVVDELCRGLARRSVRVTALVSNDARTRQDSIIEGVRVIRLAREALVNSQPLNLALVPALRELRADVVHFHTPNPVGALALLAGGFRMPMVVSHHSDIIRQKILGIPGTAAHALLYRKAARVIGATPNHIKYSPVLRTFASRCEVIHYPLDPAPFAAATPAWHEALPASWREHPLAVFVGRLVYYKGVDVLVAALAQVRNLNVAIVGTGPLEGELKALCRSHGVESRVRFLGSVPDEPLRQLYKCARFLVLPSIFPSEAFGMVQLEAMAAGRPVISTDLRSGVPYVNQHNVTGLVVPPSDPRSLAVAMQRLADDAGFASELGERAQRRVFSEFHVDQVVEQHIQLYTGLTQSAAAVA